MKYIGIETQTNNNELIPTNMENPNNIVETTEKNEGEKTTQPITQIIEKGKKRIDHWPNEEVVVLESYTCNTKKRQMWSICKRGGWMTIQNNYSK